MKIYADPITGNCRKIMAGFKLMGITYEQIHVDYFKSEQLNQDFIKINPNAALPALVDKDLVLWELDSLLQYDADKYGKSEFFPTDLKSVLISTDGYSGKHLHGSLHVMSTRLKIA